MHTHQLARGKAPESREMDYGLELASRSALPSNFVEKAKLISQRIKRSEVNVVKVNKLDQICNEHFVRLKRLARSGLSGEDRRNELKNIKMSFLMESKNLPEIQESRSGRGRGGDEVCERVEDTTLPSAELVTGQSDQTSEADKPVQTPSKKKSIFFVKEIDGSDLTERRLGTDEDKEDTVKEGSIEIEF